MLYKNPPYYIIIPYTILESPILYKNPPCYIKKIPHTILESPPPILYKNPPCYMRILIKKSFPSESKSKKFLFLFKRKHVRVCWNLAMITIVEFPILYKNPSCYLKIPPYYIIIPSYYIKISHTILESPNYIRIHHHIFRSPQYA